MSKIAINLEKLSKAVIALESIYLTEPQADRCIIDATMFRFKLVFDLLIKMIKIFLRQEGLKINYVADVLQEAYAKSILNDESTWMSIVKDRKMISRAYEDKVADKIFLKIRLYVPVLREAYNKLSQMDS